MFSGIAHVRTRCIAICCTTLALAGCAKPEPVPPQPPTTPSEVRTYLEGFLGQEKSPPSLSLAVALGSELELLETVGLHNRDGGDATPETPYRVYALSMGVTAVAIMQLWEAGTIELTDPIRRYVRELPPSYEQVQIQHLLTHTAGVRHYREGSDEAASKRQYTSIGEASAVFRDDPLLFEPGTQHHFSAFGFALLEGVIENASGQPFEDYLRGYIWGPAQMTQTQLHAPGRSIPGMAVGYSFQGFWFLKKQHAVSVPGETGRYAASGMVSTAQDLVRLFIALQSGTLLERNSIATMFEAAFPDVAPTQALGWTVEDDGALITLSTDGIGYTGIVMHWPRENLTGALLVNQTPFDERSETLLGALATVR